MIQLGRIWFVFLFFFPSVIFSNERVIAHGVTDRSFKEHLKRAEESFPKMLSPMRELKTLAGEMASLKQGEIWIGNHLGTKSKNQIHDFLFSPTLEFVAVRIANGTTVVSGNCESCEDEKVTLLDIAVWSVKSGELLMVIPMACRTMIEGWLSHNELAYTVTDCGTEPWPLYVLNVATKKITTGEMPKNLRKEQRLQKLGPSPAVGSSK